MTVFTSRAVDSRTTLSSTNGHSGRDRRARPRSKLGLHLLWSIRSAPKLVNSAARTCRYGRHRFVRLLTELMGRAAI
jgi:hypothetical protein